ncbi:uncharacterized protein RCC_05738 [Ramularia collo-cygni]|uniref:DUF7719 domain-containing protein n=1 Tax=Ramularia collo-cygni TaxID=112498 RepID=A0A2D3URR3_9PEZI|nr:uncharacterized protein RCC_05738 [Ramularia collo-cygni]CZT19882.1 uncharacterized protein RCC_05738 [Ramularia collo-cygni]
MSEDAPRNRKERRAAAKESGKPVEPPTKVPKLKLAQPDRSGPKGKTLLDVYEDKKSLLDKGRPFDAKYSDGVPRGESGNILDVGLGENEPIGLVGEAVFWSVCLVMFHFTLDVLVYNQFAQEIVWPAVIKRTFTMLPILFLVIYMLRSDLAKKFGVVRQVFFLIVGVVAGCYLIHAGNRYQYFAVMKQAPPLGTLWVYSVIEMDLWFAAGSILLNVAFLLYGGYSFF